MLLLSGPSVPLPGCFFSFICCCLRLSLVNSDHASVHNHSDLFSVSHFRSSNRQTCISWNKLKFKCQGVSCVMKNIHSDWHIKHKLCVSLTYNREADYLFTFIVFSLPRSNPRSSGSRICTPSSWNEWAACLLGNFLIVRQAAKHYFVRVNHVTSTPEWSPSMYV